MTHQGVANFIKLVIFLKYRLIYTFTEVHLVHVYEGDQDRTAPKELE